MISDEQRNLVRHALGLDGLRRSTYRNRYVATVGTRQHEAWTDLVTRGLAEKRAWASSTSEREMFWATKSLARLVLTKTEHLDREDFPE